MATTQALETPNITLARLVAELDELQRCLNKGWSKRGRTIIADLKIELAELVGRIE